VRLDAFARNASDYPKPALKMAGADPHQLAHGIAREQEEMYMRARRENRRQGEVGLRLVKIALTGGIVLNQRVTYW
jgi:hypothetical protein